MPEKTKEYYLDCGQKCLENNLFYAAIAAFNNALILDQNCTETKKKLAYAYNAFDIPNLEIVAVDEYTGSMKLPDDVNYVLVGAAELESLPELKCSDNIAYANEFELVRKYPVLAQNKFAIDFSKCKNLKKIPASLFTCNENLVCADFSGCENLKSIEDGSFSSCTALQTVVFPKGLEKIGEFAFENAELTNLDLSKTNVSVIAGCAFLYNKNLKNIKFSNQLKEIGQSAFEHCYNLQSVKLPPSTLSVGVSAFEHTAVNVVDAPKSLDTGNFGRILVRKGKSIDSTEYVRCGIEYETSGDKNKAFDYYSKAISADKKSADAYYRRGLLYRAGDSDALAINDFSSAIKHYDSNNQHLIDCRYSRGMCRLNEQQYELALQDFKEVMKIDSMYKMSYARIAKCYAFLGMRKEAIDNYTMAINLLPPKRYIYAARGKLYSQEGNHEAAVRDLQTAVGMYGCEPKNYLDLANEYFNIKKYDLALENFNKSIEADNNYISGYIGRATIYSMTGESEKADADLKKALSLSTDPADIHFKTAYLHIMQDKTEMAIDDLNNMLEISPNSKNGLALRARTYCQLRKYDLAIKDYNKLLKLDKSAQNYYYRGVAYYIQSKSDLAIKDFNKAASKNFFTPGFYVKRGDSYLEKNDYRNALNDYNNELIHNGDTYDAYIGWGNVCYSQENYYLAISKYKEAIKINENLPDAYVFCGKAYLQTDNTACAIENFKKAIAIDADCKEARKLLERACMIQKNAPEQITSRELADTEHQARTVCSKCDTGKNLPGCCKKTHM